MIHTDFIKLKNENIALLKQAYRDFKLGNLDSKEVIPFVGAGASIPLGVPSWKNLVKEFYLYSDLTGDFEIEFSQSKLSLSEYAQEIFDKTNNIDSYTNFMSNEKIFMPKTTRGSDLHESIVRNFHKIITTNYDIAFEVKCDKIRDNYIKDGLPDFAKSFEYDIVSYPELKIGNFYKTTDKKCIAYLHGRFKNDRKQFIFRECEYRTAYKSKIENPLKKFLDEFYNNSILLFIGFSFEDKYIVDYTKDILKQKINLNKLMSRTYGSNHIEQIPSSHFVFIEESEITPYIHKDELNPEFYRRNSKYLIEIKDTDYFELNINDSELKTEIAFPEDQVYFEKLIKDKNKRIKKYKYFLEIDIKIIPFRMGEFVSIEENIEEICNDKPYN